MSILQPTLGHWAVERGEDEVLPLIRFYIERRGEDGTKSLYILLTLTQARRVSNALLKVATRERTT